MRDFAIEKSVFERRPVESAGDAGEDKPPINSHPEVEKRTARLEGRAGTQEVPVCSSGRAKCDQPPEDGVKPEMKGKRGQINSLDLIFSRRRRRSTRASGVSGAPVGWRSLFTNKRGQVLSLGGCKLHSWSSVGFFFFFLSQTTITILYYYTILS